MTTTRPTTRNYATPSIVLHWLTVLLIIAVYALIEFRGIFPKGTPERDMMKAWHMTLGMTVFALTWLRLLFNAVNKRPPITPTPPQWQRTLTQIAHGLLLAFLVFLPFSGWLMVSAFGKPVPFWGLELPALIDPMREVGKNIEELHEAIAKAGYALIGLHAVAALWHHHVMKDDTLKRMVGRN